MSEESKGISLINAELPEFAENACKNLTDKPTQSIGQTISDLWQLVLGGRVAFAAEKQRLKYAAELEEFKKSLEAKVSAIPPENQIEPPLQIAAQALEDSKYCVESKELREMFASLIANSMDALSMPKIHPSFSKIIQQMSPLDAAMLKLIHTHEGSGGLPIVHFIKKISETQYETIIENIPAQLPSNCSPEMAARSIVSLLRLGLIQSPAGVSFADQLRYASFGKMPFYDDLRKEAVMRGFTLDMQRRLAMLTTIGADFVSVCLD